MCICPIWNSLPDDVVLANSTNLFKNRLDRLWYNQKVLYDYEAAYFTTGGRELKI
jgi:D-alanine-D-alanine ligase-like ATP-grasp enzyme